jgi:hypothetical protein
MKKTEFDKKVKEIQQNESLGAVEGNLHRARSFSVGTAFGGVTEITMRGNGSNFLWVLMQPVEVVELINQLAANIGCHIAIKPREDFASWRAWNSNSLGASHPPFANDMAPFNSVGITGKDTERLENSGQALENTKDLKNETVATKKPANKRTSKRSAAAS